MYCGLLSVVYCGEALIVLTHIVQDYFTGTGAIQLYHFGYLMKFTV